MRMDIDKKMVLGFKNENPPLHLRRTLNQYGSIAPSVIANPFRNQVVFKSTRERRGSDTFGRVLMVDQLWLWILDERKRQVILKSLDPL